MADGSSVLVRLRLVGASAFDRDARRAGQSLDRFGGQARKAGRDLNVLDRVHGRVRALPGLSLGAFGAAGAALGGIATVAAGLRTVASEYQESAKVGAQTNAVLRSTGGVANVSAQHVGDLATAISRKTAIDDEQIQSAANMLLTFRNIRNETGKGNKIFDQATVVLTDMSAAMGGDSKRAAIQLGKALNDPVKGVTALSRVGVTFTEKQRDQIAALVESGNVLDAQKIILRELRTEFAGSAKAQATPFDHLITNYHNLAESIGNLAAPTVNKGIKAIAGVVGNLDAIASRKDIDLNEKLKLSGQLLTKDIASLHLGEKLAQAIEYAEPKIADAMAKAAPKAAEAFIHGFRDMGPWGQLLTVGLLANRLGAFRLIGSRAATQFASGFQTSPKLGQTGTAAGGTVGGAMVGTVASTVGTKAPGELAKQTGRAKFKAGLKGIGGGIGSGIGAAVGVALTTAILNKLADGDVLGAIQQYLDPTGAFSHKSPLHQAKPKPGTSIILGNGGGRNAIAGEGAIPPPGLQNVPPPKHIPGIGMVPGLNTPRHTKAFASVAAPTVIVRPTVQVHTHLDRREIHRSMHRVEETELLRR